MITPSDLADYLGLENPGGAVLDRLAVWEGAALAFVETQTGRYFGPVAEHTEVLTGGDRCALWLSDIPLGVVSLEERACPGAEPRYLVEGTDFGVVVSGAEAWLERFGDTVWRRGYQYSAVYERGYAPGEEPADIRQLVMDLVSVRHALSGREALRGETIGGYSWTRYGASDLDAVMGGEATINTWRRPVVV